MQGRDAIHRNDQLSSHNSSDSYNHNHSQEVWLSNVATNCATDRNNKTKLQSNRVAFTMDSSNGEDQVDVNARAFAHGDVETNGNNGEEVKALFDSDGNRHGTHVSSDMEDLHQPSETVIPNATSNTIANTTTTNTNGNNTLQATSTSKPGDEDDAEDDSHIDNLDAEETTGFTESVGRKTKQAKVELQELPHNMYSVMFLAALNSKSFAFAMVVFTFQAAMTSLALVDLIDKNNSKNPLKVPEDVDIIIRSAQGLALVLSVAVQGDVKESIQIIHAGYDRSIRERLPDATFLTWAIAYTAQLLVGLAFLAVIFILVVRSSSVIEIFLNFAALAFISEIDDVFFQLGQQGFFEASIQHVCQLVDEQRIPVRRRKYPIHKTVMLVILLGMIAGWSVIMHQQFNGYFLCDAILVQFGDAYHATLPTHSGVFVKRGSKHLDGRQVYVSRDYDGDLASYFRYCHKHTAWVFQVMAFTDATSVHNICDDYLMISKTTETFNLMSLSSASDWKIRTLDTTNFRLSSLEEPVDHFYIQCTECGSGACRGPCRNDRCICEDNQFGERCEFDGACSSISIDSRTPAFSNANFFFAEAFVLLTYTDEATNVTKPVKINSRPVYIDDYPFSSGEHDFLIFNGRRWMIMDTVNVFNSTQQFINELLADQFHLSLTNDFSRGPYYLSSAVDLATPSNAATPTSLSWSRRGPVSAQDYSLGQPVDSRFLCEICDNTTNACFNEGECYGTECECFTPLTKASGMLCEREISCLEEDCANGGTCNLVTGVCDCDIDFDGRLCQIKYCAETGTFCFNGATICNPDGTCECPPGYIGEDCIEFDCTDPSVCQNGGECGPVEGCDCSDTDYEGTFCEILFT